ncbi:MAG: hypothetical protein Pg6A_19470 [Termitinemataceae bacterium]|nr:MAG: hypothetical protein Pg6A_19470 [Termitinemataceae bacterium]
MSATRTEYVLAEMSIRKTSGWNIDVKCVGKAPGYIRKWATGDYYWLKGLNRKARTFSYGGIATRYELYPVASDADYIVAGELLFKVVRYDNA